MGISATMAILVVQCDDEERQLALDIGLNGVARPRNLSGKLEEPYRLE
jgi:hypothetical protein